VLLRHRLAVLIALSLVVALAASVLLTDLVFGQIQHRQSADLIERELDRVQAVVSSGTLGQDFLAVGAGTFSLQFVTGGGRVALPLEGVEPLPLHTTPTVVRLDGEPWLVASTPWVLPSGFEIGTIRLALDLAGVEASRNTLRISLVTSGIMILSLALLGALVWLRWSLGPLVALADEAERVDPADPRLARYQGPDDEVARVAAALNRALAGIRARRQAERDALAEVAHELAAPLTVVAGQLRSLAAAHPDDRRLLAARAAADELLYTSQDLLTLARGELEVAPDAVVVDVAEVAAEIAAEYPGTVLERRAQDASVLADRERLRQVARNLVRNAVRAAGRTAGVTIRVQGDGESVALEVADDGPGLSAEARERVFDRYYSGSGQGAGVGLTVAKRIVEAFEGTIEARSAPGAGSLFVVTLPSLSSRIEREPDALDMDAPPLGPVAS
jgi:two-component system, OmpR family, sensor kinase